jgi:hypothetical protein
MPQHSMSATLAQQQRSSNAMDTVTCKQQTRVLAPNVPASQDKTANSMLHVIHTLHEQQQLHVA